MLPMTPLPSQPSAPLRPDKALPDEAPIEVDVTPEDSRAVLRAAEERQRAIRAVHRWEGRVLQPYSLGREELWLEMCQGDTRLAETWGAPALEAPHALKLLYLCDTPPAQLEAVETGELIERAEAWADDNVPRTRTLAALRLARRIRHDATVTRARQRPSDRQANVENTAIPPQEAQYAVMLAAAVPRLTLAEIRWEIPLALGWSLIHARALLDGEAMVWPDSSLSKTGRWIEAFRKRLRNRNAAPLEIRPCSGHRAA